MQINPDMVESWLHRDDYTITKLREEYDIDERLKDCGLISS